MTAYIGTRSARKWTGLVGSGGVADASVTTVPVSSTTGLTNGKVYLFYVDRVDGNGVKTPNSEELIKGTLSGSNFINCTRGVAGTAQAHSAGSVIEVLWTSTHWEELIDALEVEHNSDGTHKFSDVLTVAGVSANAGRIRLAEDTDNGSSYVEIKAPASLSGNVVFTLPDSDGDANQVLKTDGSGNLSWTAQSSLTKATGSDVTTGTDDAKYVTALGIKDGRVGLNHDIKVYVTRNTNQTITSGTGETKVAFANEIYDVGSNYDNATNYRFTAPVTGYYLVSGQIFWNTGGSAGRVYVVCKKNGSSYAFQSEIYRSGGVYHSVPFIGVVNLSANDYIEIYVTQITGASLDILGGAPYTYMGINLIGV